MRTVTVGVVGAGFIGGTLASRFAGLGHEVKIANSREPSTLTKFAHSDNVTTAWAADAVRGADIVIFSVPESSIEVVAAELGPVVDDNAIVIDTGNYYPNRDGRIPVLDDGLPDSVWVSQLLHRDVYKVFNNIGAPSLQKKGTQTIAERVGLAVAGADGPAKDTVFELVESIGFGPVNGGTLADSWRQQPGTPSYCKDLDPASLEASLAQTTLDDIEIYHRNRDEIVDFDAAAKRLDAKMT